MSILNKLQQYLEFRQNDSYTNEIVGEYKKRFARIEKFDILKRNEGWQELETALKEELKILLRQGIESNQRAQVILEILEATDTKEHTRILEEEIESFIGS